MLRFFISLAVLVFFIPTLSEAQEGQENLQGLDLPIFSFVGFSGSDGAQRHPVPPGGTLEVNLSVVDFHICIKDFDETCATDGSESGPSYIPDGAKLFSSNPDIAFVDKLQIVVRKPGMTILTLRYVDYLSEVQPSKVGTIAYYFLVVRPVRPGTFCGIDDESLDPRIIDCSGRCVLLAEVKLRLGDGICDDGSTGVDLSSCLIHNTPGTGASFATGFVNDEIDGGDCKDADSVCRARFGDAPGFQLCNSSVNVCSFNANTNGDTCEEMCQRFNSRCVAALDNNPAGCTPLPNSNDTCQTPRQSEICFCAQR